jgi:hypothetical protein
VLFIVLETATASFTMAVVDVVDATPAVYGGPTIDCIETNDTVLEFTLSCAMHPHTTGVPTNAVPLNSCAVSNEPNAYTYA